MEKQIAWDDKLAHAANRLFTAAVWVITAGMVWLLASPVLPMTSGWTTLVPMLFGMAWFVGLALLGAAGVAFVAALAVVSYSSAAQR